VLPYSETVTVLSDITAMPRVALYYETVGWIVKAGFQSGQLVAEHQVLIQQDISE
jgi:multidrug efflux pump subunit AcrA (membrane-fusion protein)